MKIEKVCIFSVLLPFRADVSHAKRTGSSARNIVVQVLADNGRIKGYGEGAPRKYVTGESPQTAAQSIKRFVGGKEFPWDLCDISQVWDFVDRLPRQKEYHAAICALEMSLLDALGKEQKRPIMEYFPQDLVAERITYGAPLPIADKDRIADLTRLIKALEMRNIKLKMGRDFTKNKEAIETLDSLYGNGRLLKVDVNGAWDYGLALKHIPLIQDYNVMIVEQPLMPGDPHIRAFADILGPHGVTLTADESACALADVMEIARQGDYTMINVRLSKCGGFRKSFEIIDFIRSSGLAFQIGSHLGESGLLSSAGRTLGLLCSDAQYYDGCYDKFLLRQNITFENVGFGKGGLAGPLGGRGLGVEVNPQSLSRLSDEPICLER